MKVWVSALNISESEWESWLDCMVEWLGDVKLNAINSYRTTNASLAILDYEYFKEAKYKIKDVITVDGASYFDGWIKFIESSGQIRKSVTVYDRALQKNLGQMDFAKSRGEFSLVEILHDRLTLVTDFYATRPIYYSIDGKKMFATSDIRSLIINSNIKWSISEEKCKYFLSSFGALGENEVSDRETFFNNINKVPPSSILTFNGSDITVKSCIDYQKELIADVIYNESNQKDLFRSCFNNSVYDRIQGCNTALMLSGGIDSSTILAAICDLDAQRNVVALNMSFKDPALYNSQDSEIAKNLIKDFEIKGGILWADDLLRIPNISLSDNLYDDPFNSIDGPNPSANKLSQEVFAYYASRAEANIMLTGEQGDAVLGEDNIILIYDSLIKSGLYSDAYNLLRGSIKSNSIGSFIKILFKHFIANLSSLTRNKFYKSTYWAHTKAAMPSYFNKKLINFEQMLKSSRNDLQSLEYNFNLVGHMYIFDYFFPRASYFDSMNYFMPHSHPFIDFNILRFVFSRPTHIHCNYKDYKHKESYASAKYLARNAYERILPDYARLKSKKTSYAGMARKILHNSKKDLISLIFERKDLYISQMELIDKHKFRRYLGAALLKMDDPNNNLGRGYQFMRVAIQMEIWLSHVNLPRAALVKMLKLKPPRQLVDIDWINK